MKRKKRPAKRVAKMRSGGVIQFRPDKPMLLVYEEAFKVLHPSVKRALLLGDWTL